MAKEINDHRHHFNERFAHHDNRMSDFHSDNQRRSAYRQKDVLLQAANNKASLELQASQYKSSIELQAANNKSYLENHITKTSADGILKTVETTSKIMEKIAECCCENRLAHATTQQIVIQNSNNNQNAIQQGENNRLQQALAQSQQEALIARFSPRT